MSDDKNIWLLYCLDKVLNVCKYFERDGKSQRGWYRRDGKECKCFGTWTKYAIEDTELFPHIEEKENVQWANIKEFREFLEENDWRWDTKYFWPRKLDVLLKSDIHEDWYKKYL